MNSFAEFFVQYWYLFATALISGGMLFWPMIRRGVAVNGVSAADAVQLINRERAVMIDVREAASYAAGHVAGAKNVPLASLKDSTALPKNKNVPVVLVCDTGALSSRGVPILRERGHANVHTLKGGLPSWREANLPIEKTA